MTSQRKIAVGVVIGAVLIAASCSESTSSGLAVKEAFVADLTGPNERPTPITTNASGHADVSVLDTNLIRVDLRVSTIDSVTQAHIHAGDASIAGPIIVFLLPNLAAGRPPITGTDVPLSSVDINRSTPVCSGGLPLPCFQPPFTLDTLFFRIRNGTAYANVHTRKNLGGEIRGQIVPK